MSEKKVEPTSMLTRWAGDWDCLKLVPADGTLERVEAGSGRRESLWAVTGYRAACGHWVSSGGHCGDFINRTAALEALLAASQSHCWTCVMEYMTKLKKQAEEE